MRAKTLTPLELRVVQQHILARCNRPELDRGILLLSFRAGLRAQEIALLGWAAVLTPAGELAPSIEISAGIAKKGSARTIPMHPELREALAALRTRIASPRD